MLLFTDSFFTVSSFCSMTFIFVSCRFFTVLSFFSLALHFTSFCLLLPLACVSFSMSCFCYSPYWTICCSYCRSINNWFCSAAYCAGSTLGLLRSFISMPFSRKISWLYVASSTSNSLILVNFRVRYRFYTSVSFSARSHLSSFIRLRKSVFCLISYWFFSCDVIVFEWRLP